MNSVLVSFVAKQTIPNAFGYRATSSATQAVIPLSRWGVRQYSALCLCKPAYSNEPAASSNEPAASSNKPAAFSNKREAFSNVSAAISCFTPALADRLHYNQGLPGGGLDIYEA